MKKMPRPGPRPYECAKRAWHSDRHQPIRGSLIQEIFRVVNEVHSLATKKNKEWQEKLPVVVLKAEEIIYSKANSEAEYMDLKTLWDRTNDAINTIIRRDETTETGELLQPCIEAALTLGCPQRTATRSQRNCHPKFYLSTSNQEPNHASPGAMHSAIQVDHVTNPHGLLNYSNLIKPSIINSTHSGAEPQNLVDQNNVSSNRYLFTTDKVPQSNFFRGLPPENYPLCSVYPLYYGSCQEHQQAFEVLPKTVSSTKEPVKVTIMQNFFPCNEDAPVKLSQADHRDSPVNPQEIGCDLSLRLGSPSAPLRSVETKQLQFAKDGEDGCPEEHSKFNDWIPQMDRDFSFFTRVYMDEPLDSRPSKLSEHINVDATMKKRKAVCDHTVDDQQFCWQPKLPCNQLTGRVKTAGS